MIANAPRWERQLIAMAQEGVGEQSPVPSLLAQEDDALEIAYEMSEMVTAEHSRSFHFASRFLPWDKRRAIRALYAFCRLTDDIVDEPKADPAAALESWQSSMDTDPNDPISLAWRDTRNRFKIPNTYAHQLIDGVARDLQPTRYESFGSLARYCYGVASTVGLMSMHIIGFKNPDAMRYAVKMGVALQLTNILRDVGDDLRLGRVYLPQDELAFYGVSEDDLSSGVVTDRWRRFMQYQIGRARQLYREAWPGIALLSRDGRFAVMAAAELYGGILSEIEANDYDVFTKRAHLSAPQKLSRLPGIWYRARFSAPRTLQRELGQ